jgi:cytochrome c
MAASPACHRSVIVERDDRGIADQAHDSMRIRTLLASACALIATSAQADETPKQLATRYLCFGCHAVAETRAGPSFMDVAERYGKRKDAVAYLLKELKDGSAGKWGSTPMPAEIAPEPELKRIVQWVLEQ